MVRTTQTSGWNPHRFLAVFHELLRRYPSLPDVDLVVMPMDVPGPASATLPPLFAQARFRRAAAADRQWLLPSFDTFRLEGGDVDDVAPAAARERSGAFWRGTVRGFRGYSAEAMVARRFRLTNLNHDPSAANPHALAEPYDARVQFSGGVGNWRRWTVTTACDAGDDRLDVVEPGGVAVVDRGGGGGDATRARGAGVDATEARRAIEAAAAAGAGPASFKLLNYGFGDHGAICAKEALLYLDGISTSNGLKYYLACGAPVLMDRASRFEDLITAAWPMVAGGNLTEGVDYVAVGAAADDVRADERTRAAAEKRFCGDVAAAVDGLRRNPADAAAMGARGRRAALAVGTAARGLEYLAVWKSNSELGYPDQTSELSRSVKSKSIRLIFGRIDCSRRFLEHNRRGTVSYAHIEVGLKI